MSSVIIMTDQDRERWEESLVEYFRAAGVPDSEIKPKIDKAFAECQAGWNRAPRDLDTRIKVKTGFQWKSHANLQPKQKEMPEVSAVEEDEDDTVEGQIFKYLSKYEKNWWEDRMKIYTKDFEFNKSSDEPLLHQLLVEELIQQRLQKKSLKKNSTVDNKALNDSLKRITELQQKLGITREQRAGVMNKIDGNVAQLAMQLDEKLELMPERMKKDYEEELYFTNLKSQRPPINMLPPIEKIEALLQIDGKVSGNIDSERISEISEEVAKEITEQRETEKEPKIKELPDGIDVS